MLILFIKGNSEKKKGGLISMYDLPSLFCRQSVKNLFKKSPGRSMQSEGAPAPNAVPSLGNLLCMPEETQFVSLCFCESDWGSVINWTSQLSIIEMTFNQCLADLRIFPP